MRKTQIENGAQKCCGRIPVFGKGRGVLSNLRIIIIKISLEGDMSHFSPKLEVSALVARCTSPEKVDSDKTVYL